VDVLHEVDTAVGAWKSGDAAKFREIYFALEQKLGHGVKIDLLKKFNDFLRKFSKKYNSLEESCNGLKAFLKNIQRIKQHQAADPSATYSHLTPLADMSKTAFDKRNNLDARQMNGVRPAPESAYAKANSLPSSYDWRAKGAVNPIKDQAQCGSCWAFCTVANIEGVSVVQGGQALQALSEQELVDCSASDAGCNGGLMPRAYEDMINGKMGLELESAYPYHATVGSCRKDSSQYKVFINDWVQVSTDEDKMAAALVQYGPLAIAFNAEAMQFYQGGIADPSSEQCSPTTMNHGVNIVGFGEEGKKYWIIRNSWGTIWGEEGYYRLARGKGACGVNQLITTATITSRGPQQEIVV
jgi:cathepsin F